MEIVERDRERKRPKKRKDRPEETGNRGVQWFVTKNVGEQ